MTDLEVAMFCYDAVMNSKIKFENVKFRKARIYIEMTMSKSELMMSPLRRVLPWRTAKGGVRPWLTADPDKEDNWEFPGG